MGGGNKSTCSPAYESGYLGCTRGRALSHERRLLTEAMNGYHMHTVTEPLTCAKGRGQRLRATQLPQNKEHPHQPKSRGPPGQRGVTSCASLRHDKTRPVPCAHALDPVHRKCTVHYVDTHGHCPCLHNPARGASHPGYVAMPGRHTSVTTPCTTAAL